MSSHRSSCSRGRRSWAALLLSSAVLAVAPAVAHAQSVTTIVGGSSPVVGVGPEPARFVSVASHDDPDAAVERQAVTPQGGLEVLRSKARAEIAKRLRRLDTLTDRLSRTSADCGVNASLLAQVQTARIGLTGLGVAIAAEVDPTKARAKYRQIFGDYRVYLLLTPKVDAAMRCAHDLDRISHARASMARVQQQLAVLVGRGVDVAAMNSALATATALLVSAEAKSRAAASSVAGLVPDQFDAARLAANNAALAAARAEFKAVDELIKQAKHWIGVANSNAGTATRTVSRPITVPRDTKVHDKSARDAEKAAEKAAEKLAREAEKAARDAQKVAEKAARDAAKADRQSDEDEGNDKGNDKGRGRNNDH